MAPTHSKHDKRTIAKNRTRLLKPAIGLKWLKKIDESKYDEKIKCHTYPGNADSTTYKILIFPTLGTRLKNSGFSSKKDHPVYDGTECNLPRLDHLFVALHNVG